MNNDQYNAVRKTVLCLHSEAVNDIKHLRVCLAQARRHEKRMRKSCAELGMNPPPLSASLRGEEA